MDRLDAVGMIILGLVLLAIVSSPVACSMNDNYAITEMVKAGAHPMDARCAVKLSGSSECAVRAAQKETPK